MGKWVQAEDLKPGQLYDIEAEDHGWSDVFEMYTSDEEYNRVGLSFMESWVDLPTTLKFFEVNSTRKPTMYPRSFTNDEGWRDN